MMQKDYERRMEIKILLCYNRKSNSLGILLVFVDLVVTRALGEQIPLPRHGIIKN